MRTFPEIVQRHRRSTKDVEPRRALWYWNEKVFESQLDIDSPSRFHFSGQLEFAQLGPAGLFIVEADAQFIRRSRALAAQRQVPGYMLVQVQSGQLRLEQHGRCACLAAGGLVLIDLSAPLEMELSRSRSVGLFFRQDWLRNWIPAPQKISTLPFRSESGWGAALAAALTCLGTEGNAPLALPAGIVAEQMAALLSLAAGTDVQETTAAQKLLHRIQRTIRNRCFEAGLTPGAIAEEHGISKRYLHHLLASGSTTFTRELMQARLQMAHRMLSDIHFDTLSVAQVSARCGFVEPGHFARRFRRAFGMTPTQFRAARRRGMTVPTEK